MHYPYTCRMKKKKKKIHLGKESVYFLTKRDRQTRKQRQTKAETKAKRQRQRRHQKPSKRSPPNRQTTHLLLSGDYFSSVAKSIFLTLSPGPRILLSGAGDFLASLPACSTPAVEKKVMVRASERSGRGRGRAGCLVVLLEAGMCCFGGLYDSV